MDIVSALRDAFIGDEDQTPHFVAQLNGKEQFIDDAKKLNALRQSLDASKTMRTPSSGQSHVAANPPRSLLERLQAAEDKVVTPKLMGSFIGKVFDDLSATISSDEFAEFFSLERAEHSSFYESTTEQFIIRVLTKEARADNFVTASHERRLRKPNSLYGSATFDILNPSAMYDEYWDLRLNVTMERCQLKMTFTPKFANLQQIRLEVTSAPSLDHCYIFEIATQHRLRDFSKYDSDGEEVSRRWWKCVWAEGPGTIVDQVRTRISELVRQQLESAEKRLSGENSVDS